MLRPGLHSIGLVLRPGLHSIGLTPSLPPTRLCSAGRHPCAQGIYTGTAGTGVAVVSISSNITIRAATAGQAILDGENNLTCVQTQPESGLTLKGLVMMRGYAPYGGAGINIIGGAVLVLSCTICNNTAARQGGGVFVCPDATVAFEMCQIHLNVATISHGGGIYITGGNVTFESCQIHTNVCGPDAGGGGVGITDASMYRTGRAGTVVTFIGSSIYKNNASRTSGSSGFGGGGVKIRFGVVTFESCQIHSNSGNWGGGLYIFDRRVSLYACEIYGNTASYGAGACLLGGELLFENCQIHSNNSPRKASSGCPNHSLLLSSSIAPFPDVHLLCLLHSVVTHATTE
eukprot:1071107-Prymnesium_polylepis.2